MPTERILRAISDLEPGDHLGFLYQTEIEHRALLAPYLRQGLDRGEQVLFISSVHPPETVLEYLRNDGLAPEPYLASGQLRLLTPAETYLRSGAFDPDDMIAFWQAEMEQALAAGYQALRGAGELTWALQELSSAERLFEYETKLSTFLPGTDCLIICLYQGPRLDTEMLFNLLSTHPTAAASPGIYGHFFYLPSVDLVQGGLPVAIMRYWLDTLAERKRMETRLERSRRRLQAIFEHALDGILLVDDEMRYVDANLAACAMLGYSREELLQLTILDLTPPQDREFTQKIWPTLISHGQHQGEYLVRRRDGTIMPVEYRAVANVVPGLHLGVFHDISQRRRYTTRLEGLAEISQALAQAGLDVQAVLDTIVQHTSAIVGDACVLSLLSSDEQSFTPVAFHHRDPQVNAQLASLFLTPVPADQAWFAHIIRTGQDVFIPVVDQDELRQLIQPEYLSFVEQIGIHSMLVVPLRGEGGVIGTLGLTRDRPGHPYTTEDQVLLQALADRATLTIEKAHLFEQVRGGRERLQTLSRRLLAVQEAERRLIARELHDEVGQILTGLKLLLDMSLRAPAETVTSHLSEAQQLVNELMERVDELSLDLRPAMLDDLGLLPTLLVHFERYSQQTQIQVTFQQTGLEGRRFSSEIETTVYRLIQEALTNVARHAEIDQATVRVWVNSDTLGVEIEDQGQGFDPQVADDSLGLSGMRERVTLLEGHLTIESAPGQGTSITAELPLSGASERSEVNDDNHSG